MSVSPLAEASPKVEAESTQYPWAWTGYSNKPDEMPLAAYATCSRHLALRSLRTLFSITPRAARRVAAGFTSVVISDFLRHAYARARRGAA
jgi:hypothetical protein